MKPLPKTGLPSLDQPSWDKGFADGFRGNVWWPGPGTEPLSYASGYTEAQVERGTRGPSFGRDARRANSSGLPKFPS
jgi:hypothetical protein